MGYNIKKTAALCLGLLLPVGCSGQTVASLRALKARYEAKSKRIALTCQLINGDSAQTFYKPTTWDYCARLSFLTIRDAKIRKEMSYFPCTYVADFDHVTLTAANTVALPPGGTYTFTQYLNASHLRPYLLRGHTYALSFAFNHEYLCGGRNCQAFRGMLRSNVVYVTVP